MNIQWYSVYSVLEIRKWVTIAGCPVSFLRCQPIEDLMKHINTWMSMDNYKSEMRLSVNLLGCQDACLPGQPLISNTVYTKQNRYLFTTLVSTPLIKWKQQQHWPASDPSILTLWGQMLSPNPDPPIGSNHGWHAWLSTDIQLSFSTIWHCKSGIFCKPILSKITWFLFEISDLCSIYTHELRVYIICLY